MRGLVGAPVVDSRADGHRPRPARAGDGRGAVRPPHPGVRRPPGPGRCPPGPHPAGRGAEQHLGRLRGSADPQALSARRRRREPGPGTRTLSDRETSFPHIARVAGALEYHRDTGEPTTVGILHGFVPHQGDAWAVHPGGPRPLLCGGARPAARGARRGAPPVLARPGGGGRPAAGQRP